MFREQGWKENDTITTKNEIPATSFILHKGEQYPLEIIVSLQSKNDLDKLQKFIEPDDFQAIKTAVESNLEIYRISLSHNLYSKLYVRALRLLR